MPTFEASVYMKHLFSVLTWSPVDAVTCCCSFHFDIQGPSSGDGAQGPGLLHGMGVRCVSAVVIGSSFDFKDQTDCFF